MCSKYQSVRLDDDLRNFFRAMPVAIPDDLKKDVFPSYEAPLIPRPRERDSGEEAVPECEAVVGGFGLIPHYAKEEKLKFTHNARSETAARAGPLRLEVGPALRHSGLAIWEPNWRGAWRPAAGPRPPRHGVGTLVCGGMDARWTRKTGLTFRLRPATQG